MQILEGLQYLELIENDQIIGFDVETTALKPIDDGLRLISLYAPAADTAVVIDLWEYNENEILVLDDFFSQERTWVAHNAAFDLGWLQAYYWYPEGEVRCTMIADQMIGNGKKSIYTYGLKDLCKKYLHLDINKEEQASD